MQILKMQLASLFKLAEQHASNGVPKGDVIYLRLLSQVGNSILQFEAKHGEIDADVEIPAFRDLKALTVPDVKPNIAAIAAMIVVGIFTAAFASGVLVHVAAIGFHLFGR